MESEATLTTQQGRRPIPITIFCILGTAVLLLSLLAAPTMSKLLTESIGAWYVPVWIASIVVSLASFVGYWLMRRWGVYLYTAAFIVGTVLGLVLGVPFTLPGVIVPLAVIALGFVYFRRMT